MYIYAVLAFYTGHSADHAHHADIPNHGVADTIFMLIGLTPGNPGLLPGQMSVCGETPSSSSSPLLRPLRTVRSAQNVGDTLWLPSGCLGSCER